MTEENDPHDPENFEFEDPTPESMAPDAYEELDSTPAPGGIEAPTVVGTSGPRRSLAGPILKVAGGLVVVGAIAAGGYAFGPALMKSGTKPAAPLQAASLTKELQSTDGEVRKKANDRLLKDLLESPNLPTAADIGALKELRAALSQQTDANSQQTVQLIDQLLESVGAAPAADVTTSSVTVPVSAGTLAPVGVPFPYSVVLAVIGQQPDAAPLPDKASNYLAWYTAKLNLADRENKQGNYEAALGHVRDLETSGVQLAPVQQRLVEQNRRKAIEGLMKALRKSIDEGDQQISGMLAGVADSVTKLKEGEVLTLSNDVKNLSEGAKVQAETLKTLDGDFKTLGGNVETVAKDLKTASETLGTVKKNTDDLTADVKTLTDNVKTASTTADTLKGRFETLDKAVRGSIVALLDNASLADRAGKLRPKPANKAAIDKAVAEINGFDKVYRDSLAMKSGDALWTDYEKLRGLEDQVAEWESRQQIDRQIQTLLDSPTAKTKIEALVKAGITAEKGDTGLLADLTRLAKITFPMDLVGKEEILGLIKEYVPAPSSSGTGGTVVRTGITPADVEKLKTTFPTKPELEARVRKAEQKAESELAATASQLRQEIRSVEVRLEKRIQDYSQQTRTQLANMEATQAKTVEVLDRLAEEVKKPRPLSADQLAALKSDLEGTVKENVVKELAQRGIAATTPPECKLPTEPTPEADRKKALFQFNQGCTYFYQGGSDRMAAASRCFSVATNLDPNDPTYRYFLGCALYNEGRAADGVLQVRCAAELEKQQQLGTEVNQRLERIQYTTRQWLERCRQPVLQGF